MRGRQQRAEDIQRRTAALSTPGIERLIDSPHRFAQTRRCACVFPAEMGAVLGLLRAVASSLPRAVTLNARSILWKCCKRRRYTTKPLLIMMNSSS
jgi:hypothetical protein